MPVIDPARVPIKTGSIYPEPYAAMMQGRSSLRLGEAGGLTQFGVNLVMLEPGAMSSLRHWHHNEDEFVWSSKANAPLCRTKAKPSCVPATARPFPRAARTATIS
jgi:hypothetical protein